MLGILSCLALLLIVFSALGGEIAPTSGELRAERLWLKQHLLKPKPLPSSATPAPLPGSKTPEPGLDVFAIRDQGADAGFAPIARATQLPLSFAYGGESSDNILARWSRKIVSKKLDAFRTERTVAWTSPDAGLQVRCVAVEYTDFPVTEWTVYFRNAGHTNSLILDNIQALDTTFARVDGPEFVLHGNKGHWCAPLSGPILPELRVTSRKSAVGFSSFPQFPPVNYLPIFFEIG